MSKHNNRPISRQTESIPVIGLPDINNRVEEIIEHEEPIVDILPSVIVKPVEVKYSYSFPKEPACPKCGGLITRATSTADNIQYRKCLNCQHPFKSIGILPKNS